MTGSHFELFQYNIFLSLKNVIIWMFNLESWLGVFLGVGLSVIVKL